ncbi:MAG: Hsp20/alpha crystallin family protein, partial [Candidatus Sungbacteria bacterium]|nr:Hsp20/alpha crystallin family protein [Candidatus Sungbacteria bacterium]
MHSIPMANDSRSFFERLTGSTKLQDGSSMEEEPIEVPDEPKFAPTTNPLLKRKISYAEEDPKTQPMLAASSTARAMHPKTALPQIHLQSSKKMSSMRENEEENEKENRVRQPHSMLPEEPREEESEVEGQLTVDIYDDGDSIVIQSTLAGVKSEDLDVTITNDMITIRGRRKK